MENPIKMGWFGGTPIFGNTQINQFQNAKFPHFFSPAFSSIGTPETSRSTKKRIPPNWGGENPLGPGGTFEQQKKIHGE